MIKYRELNRPHLVLWLLLACQACFLFIGFTHYAAHPDELAPRFTTDSLWSDWRPFDLKYPTTHVYTLQIIYATLVKLGLLEIFDYFTYNRIGRVVTSLMALGCTVLAYRIGRSGNYSRWQSLTFSTVIAAYPLLICLGRFSTTDVPNLFWCLLSLQATLYAIKHPKQGTFALAGLCAGMAIGVKYLGVLFVPGFAAAIILNLPKESLTAAAKRSLVLTWGLCIGVGFVVSTPYAVITFQTFCEKILYLQNAVPAWSGVQSPKGAIGIPISVAASINPIFTIFCVTGFAKMVTEFRRPLHVNLLITPLVYYLFMFNNHFYPWRFLLPLFVLLLIIAAIGFVWMTARLTGRFARFALIGSFVFGLGIFLREDASIVYNFIHESRYEAAEWLKQHLRPGYRVAFPKEKGQYSPGVFLEPNLVLDSDLTSISEGLVYPPDVQYGLVTKGWASRTRNTNATKFKKHIQENWEIAKVFELSSFWGKVPVNREFLSSKVIIYRNLGRNQVD